MTSNPDAPLVPPGANVQDARSTSKHRACRGSSFWNIIIDALPAIPGGGRAARLVPGHR